MIGFKKIVLTLLVNISVSSKWRPNIFGESPGIGSILMQTSWPLRAVSTCLWLHSIDVTIPISKNWKEQNKYWIIQRYQTQPQT